MRLPWPARQYERTCADCGNCWRVPRQLAKHVKPARLSHSGRASPYVDAADAEAYDRRVEVFEAYRVCPKCSSQHYSQRPVRS
jgi:hypothetical protein